MKKIVRVNQWNVDTMFDCSSRFELINFEFERCRLIIVEFVVHVFKNQIISTINDVSSIELFVDKKQILEICVDEKLDISSENKSVISNHDVNFVKRLFIVRSKSVSECHFDEAKFDITSQQEWIGRVANSTSDVSLVVKKRFSVFETRCFSQQRDVFGSEIGVMQTKNIFYFEINSSFVHEFVEDAKTLFQMSDESRSRFF